MHLAVDTLSTGSFLFLGLALFFALSFEFVNGFHDTANAVATVIYTHTLRPWVAVVWSGIWNLIGVLTSSGGVAFAVLALLPVELIVNIGSGPGFAMVFALLIAAIIWNVGTWYLGLPASSSHTLVGSIMGVGLANALLGHGHFGAGVNWAEVTKVFRSLLVSPLVGFTVAALLLLLAKKLLAKRKELFEAPTKDAPPPGWVRGLLVLTCTGVSFAHGSNDGQKGMGLILLILIGILPGTYAINPELHGNDMASLAASAAAAAPILAAHADGTTLAPADAATELSAYLATGGVASAKTFAALALVDARLAASFAGKSDLSSLNIDQRKALRTDIYMVSAAVAKLVKDKRITAPSELAVLVGAKGVKGLTAHLNGATQFIPSWVKFAVAIALGLGTMIGWKRIVVTVGEKIGKAHLTYAQGASAELVAMATIIAADQYHLPVSTTHVLSSGVAGTMAANRSGLQTETLRNLLLAWVLTLPASVLLGALTFAGGLYIVLHSLVVHTLAVAGVLVAVLAVLVLRRLAAKRAQAGSNGGRIAA
ncbi:MAG TPA: inorganic phosphate transporter [Polyangia bacterium]|jgi:PiT family inorganic phosphate transporter